MKSRKAFEMIGLAVVAAAVSRILTGTAARAEEPGTRPNIVLIMADDMGYSDIGCYGGEIETPTLDRLAAEGVRFTRFYNASRCCPTRASLLTGLYPHQAGMGGMTTPTGNKPGYRGDLNKHCVTLAQVLKQAGYATFMAGKWHVTAHVGHWSGKNRLTSKHNWPLQRGFDSFYGGIFGVGNHFNPATLTRDNTPIEPETERYHFTDAIGRNTVDFIRAHNESSAEEQPFFCYVAFSAPHWAIQAWPEDIAKYKGRYDEGWDVAREARFKRMQALGIVNEKYTLSPRDRKVPAWEDAGHKAWQARRMEVYAAMVDQMDRAIGTIVDTIEEAGQLDNTLILFLSDNGASSEELRPNNYWIYPKLTRDGKPVQQGNDPSVMPGPPDTYQSYGLPWANVSNTPFRRYKMYEHEGGTATPLIVHWPARVKQQGALRWQVGHVIDIMPTLIEVSGASYPETFNDEPITPFEGISLIPAFDDNQPLEREALFWEHLGNKAVRMGGWKLVSQRRGQWELYNIEDDPTELNNLAARMPEKVEQMAEAYHQWARRCLVE
jgi:arylsulfatase A-like enzyme